MAQGWKTVRVFVSSTFRNTHAERNHLVRHVFKELKEKCRTKHVQLIDVGLRWDVTEADAEHGKALDICLDEIDSCRPYFLGILGIVMVLFPKGTATPTPRRKSITEYCTGAFRSSSGPAQVLEDSSKDKLSPASRRTA